MKLKELETPLLEHCYEMSILKKDAPVKKKESILDSLIAAIVRSETSYEEVLDCINDVKSNNVIDISFFDKGGDVDNFINPKWLNFAKALWRQRSVGLGTPNAASGEGELMFIFLSPSIKKPVKGDLTINGLDIELKGEGVRVNGKVGGKEFRTKTLDVCKKFNLTPNKAYKTNLEAVEIEKVQHLEHWSKELQKLSTEKQTEFINEWLKCLDNKEHNFNTEFNHSELLKEIVKSLYSSMVDDRAFDKFVLLGDGKNTKILQGNIIEFNEKIDSGEIKIDSDYFRINQDASIGWYIH